jgi:hypothetical protein
MRIHIRNPLRHHISLHVGRHVQTRLRSRLDVVLLALGAFLMVVGFMTDGDIGRGKFSPGTHIDFASWLMFGGLVAIACGALMALRRSHPE